MRNISCDRVPVCHRLFSVQLTGRSISMALVSKASAYWPRPIAAMSESCSWLELLQQRLRFSQVERVEALGEPAIDRGQKIVGLLSPALVAPKTG
jgi:hypothetical protein